MPFSSKPGLATSKPGYGFKAGMADSGLTVTAQTASLSVAGTVPGANFHAAPTATLDLAGTVPSILGGITLSAPTATLTINGQAVKTQIYAPAPAAQMTAFGRVPAVAGVPQFAMIRVAPTGQVALRGVKPRTVDPRFVAALAANPIRIGS